MYIERRPICTLRLGCSVLASDKGIQLQQSFHIGHIGYARNKYNNISIIRRDKHEEIK